MSFFADLVVDILGNTLIVRASRSKHKGFFLVSGALTILAAIGLLVYTHSIAPLTAEKLQRREIRYTHATSDTKHGIALRAEDGDYIVERYIMPAEIAPELIVEKLNRSTDASVWTDGLESHEVVGIATRDFSIDPSVGVKWQNANDDTGKIVAWGFLGAGLFLCIVPVLLRSS
jgi:hypothetical protein